MVEKARPLTPVSNPDMVQLATAGTLCLTQQFDPRAGLVSDMCGNTSVIHTSPNQVEIIQVIELARFEVTEEHVPE
jgi:hypothetical protein